MALQRLASLFAGSGSDKETSARQKSSGAEYLERQIHALTLTGVDDIFDADSLWSAQHTRKAGIRNRANGSATHRLYVHLKANKHRVPSHDARSGRLLGVRHVFTDLVVQINHDQWRNELRSGDPAFALLTYNLALRHREDFKRDLKLCARAPRCAIVPADDLHQDEVRFLFGRGIFVPDQNDVQRWVLGLRDAAGHLIRLPEWELYDLQGRAFKRPIGLYEGQRTFLLRGPSGPALVPLTVPEWPAGDQGFIQLSRLPSSDQWQVFDDGEGATSPQQDGVEGESGHAYSFSRLGGAAQLSLVVSEQPDQDSIGLEKSELLANPVPPSSKPRSLGPAHDKSARQAGPATHVLRLAGVALPRISGASRLKRKNGVFLQSWRLWLDGQGGLAQGDGLNTDRLAMVSADAEQDRLLVRPAGASEAEPIEQLPFRFRVSTQAGGHESLLGAPLRERHLGLLWLPPLVELALAYRDEPLPGPRWLGRKANDGVHPELVIDFLDQPGSLVWSRPGVAPDTLGQLELSRQHLRVAVNADQDCLEVTPPELGKPVVSLVFNQGLERIETLKPGDPARLVEPGHYLLMGCYLMRFELLNDADDRDQTLIFHRVDTNQMDATLVLAAPNAALIDKQEAAD